jgi:hypothetical protein
VRRLLIASTFAFTFAFALAAVAQPMMVDPSRMSGIPRPDPQVPAGTITVRLIRGELSNRVVGTEVVLEGADGSSKKAKTDDQGRATFSGLDGSGPFRAKASDGTVELASQPIELQAGMGSRVMLVFPAAGGADGMGRPDKTVPAGTVIVKTEDGDGKPIAGLDVVLGQARAGENGVRELKGKTNADGEATFTGLDAKPTSGYLVEAVKDGTRYAGKPFRLVENMGSRVTLSVRPVSRDVAQLSFGPESRFVFEVQDDAVQVIEILYLENPTTLPIDPGAGGLHIPLPEKAASAIVGPQAPANLSVNGHEAVWKGPVPPGETMLTVMYLMATGGARLELSQPTPVPFGATNVITEKIEGFAVEGQQMTPEDRDMNGRAVVIYRGPPSPAGGNITLTLTGLPHPGTVWSLVAAALAIAIVIGFTVHAMRGAPVGASSKEKLEQRRDHLLDELAAMDASDPKKQKKRDELTEKLARLYKELDEVA